ncbi:hypothetical protein RJ641_033889 [Dillenia turbinata]|uniref:Low-temperature-induced 65 kDa protein n=1 Tax=Dillenia turbinata TaxID=194707 RepID=A0AAN8VS58_9MAGN
MDAQTGQPQVHTFDDDPHLARAGRPSAIEGENEHHQEKPSVLKKVKAKARKIKDTIKKHGYGYHEHDRDCDDEHYNRDKVPDDHDLDEEDDEDDNDEMHADPPVHDPTRPTGLEAGHGGNVGPPRESYGAPTASTALEQGLKATDVPEGVASANFQGNIIEPTRRVAPEQEGNSISRKIRDSLGKQAFPLEDHGPKDDNQISDPGNYQTKVNDPTSAGGEEAGVTPLLSSLEKMNMREEAKTDPKQPPYTGSHDQFAPEPPTEETEKLFTDKHRTAPENQPPCCTQKVSPATSGITDKAINAKNMVTSILGYGTNTTEPHSETGTEAESGKSASVTDHSRKVASTVTEKLTPLYKKVASAAVPKVYGKESEMKGQDRGVSIKEYLAEKLRPGEEDKALSDVISDAVHKRKEEPGQKMGRVTESEEVRRQLGSSNEETESIKGNVDAQSGVVGRIKGAVTSLFGRGGDHTEALQGSGNENLYGAAGDEADQDQGNVAGRRLQESSN